MADRYFDPVRAVFRALREEAGEAARGRLRPLFYLQREWKSLCRMRTAVLLLAVVGGLSIIASLLPQKALEPEFASTWIQRHHLLGPVFDQLGLFSVFDSWPLLVAATLMYVSLTHCVWTRSRALVRRWRRGLPRNPQFWGEAGSLVFHASFFVLLAGVLYNLAGGFGAYVNVLEGDSVVEARSSYDHIQEGALFNPDQHKGFEVKVDRFNAAYYSNGKPSDFVSHVEVFDQGRKVDEAGHPRQPVPGVPGGQVLPGQLRLGAGGPDLRPRRQQGLRRAGALLR